MLSPSWIRQVGRILRHDITLIVLLVGTLGIWGAVLVAALGGESAQARAVAHELEPSALAPEHDLATLERPIEVARVASGRPAQSLEVIEGVLASGQTLAHALSSRGVGNALLHAIDRGMRPSFDFRRARPGHRYRLMRDAAGELVEFRYYTSELVRYVLKPLDDGLVAAREELVLRPEVVRLAGVVTSTLHESIVQLGERGQLANDFSDIFAWDIDFSRSVRPGDEFQVLYERLYRTNVEGREIYERPGRILAARYQGASGEHSAFYYEAEEGRGGYYRADGSSVQGMFLQAPLRYSRITSRFTNARRHPILKVTRPHHGIDYAAPRGTPLWAVGDGKVIYRGWAGGFGNLVKIQHESGYVSHYAHLTRFASGLKVGKPVSQKQVIGYVGSTGLSTGPHVCFRISQNGKYVNPRVLQGTGGPPLPASAMTAFAAARDGLLADLGVGPLVPTTPAAL